MPLFKQTIFQVYIMSRYIIRRNNRVQKCLEMLNTYVCSLFEEYNKHYERIIGTILTAT